MSSRRDEAHRPRCGARDRHGGAGIDDHLRTLAGEPEPVPRVDDGLARPQAGEHLAALVGLGEQPLEQSAGDAATAVGRQHADAGDAVRRHPRPTGHERVEAVAGDVADARVAVPRAERVAVDPRRLGLRPGLVVGGRVHQRDRHDGTRPAPFLGRGRTDHDLGHAHDRRGAHPRALGGAELRTAERFVVRRRGGRGRRCRSTGGAACSSPAPRSGGCARG